MRDYLGTDIKLTTDWDFSVVDGDIELVTGVDCLKQDLMHAFLTPLFYWGMSPEFGSRLIEFVQGSNEPLFIADLRRSINEVYQREPRVVTDSWLIDLYKCLNKIEIETEFLPIEQETAESMEFVIDTRGL